MSQEKVYDITSAIPVRFGFGVFVTSRREQRHLQSGGLVLLYREHRAEHSRLVTTFWMIGIQAIVAQLDDIDHGVDTIWQLQLIASSPKTVIGHPLRFRVNFNR